MTLDRTAISGTVGRRTVRSASKLLLAGVVIVLLLYLLTLLPGMDRLIPATGMTIGTIITAIVTVVVVGLLLKLAASLAALAALLLAGPEPIVEHLTGAVYWLTVLAAILVAHAGFQPLAAPILDGRMVVYDLLFLVMAIPPLVIIAARLYLSIDPASEFVADTVTE